jgi:hypothetical protein
MERIINGKKYGIKPGADLYNAYLSGAYLYGADLRGAYLYGADLRGADLRGADLRGADLRGADLRGADLRGAYLYGADLRGAYLYGADLRGADLRGAYLSGAYLYGADLRDANLRGAEIEENTALTDKRPIQILGLKPWSIILFDTNKGKYGKIGCKLLSLEEWEQFTEEQAKKESCLETFKHRDVLLSLLRNF